ncbi:MAG: cell division protein ZapE [Proteobacteria bacterium]|nr:cell division protein ZapE [Pseudomonadota bacterium]
MGLSVKARYAALVEAGQIEPDAAQAAVIERLDSLARTLAERQLAAKGSALGWMFGRKAKPEPPPKGLYIWGSVGRGKTMLMDLFFDGLAVRHKRRAHFHAFMSDVHERIHLWRQASRRGEVKGSDPVAPVAAMLAKEATVLCFDEFAVTDIADAMLLGRLFEALFAEGVTIVATSNRDPVDLYKDGLNRQLFLPFIAMLQHKLVVLKLDARTDYRMEKLAGAQVYLVPLGSETERAINEMFRRMTGGAPTQPAHFTVKGRALTVPVTAHGVARCTFEELCLKPLGASDYLAIAHAFHTVFIEGVRVMGQDSRNECKRFITLIDVFYDTNVKVVISAEAPADELYRGTTGAEVFEFDRTVSRLIDMRSEEYLARPHGRSDEGTSGSSEGLVET